MVGEPPFQAAHRLVVRLSRDDLGVVVVPSGTASHPHLGERDNVQSEIDMAVSAAGEAVPSPVGASHLDRRDASVVGERRRSRKAARSPGVSQQPGGDDRPDAVDLKQVAAGGGDGVGDLSGERLEPLVGVDNDRLPTSR